MAYRDDLEASQARADALERELAEARDKISELEEGPSQALVRTGPSALARGESGSPAARTWLGAPLRLEFIRELDGEIPESAYTEIVERIRSVLSTVGTVSILPGSLAWAATGPSSGVGAFVNIYITIRDGKTVIRGEEKLGNLAGALFGGVGGGVGGGGVMVPLSIAFVAPVLIVPAIALWLGGTYAVCRKLYRSRTGKRAERLESLIVDIAKIAEKHIE